VLLHGFMMSHWYFNNILRQLAETNDVIAIDLPGFGESDRPAPQRYGYDGPAYATTVAQVMDALQIERATVLGHSMGGGAALAIAARRPERVERLVLVSPAVYPLPMPALAKILLQPMLGPFVWSYLFTKGELRRAMLRDHFKDPAPVTDEFVDYYWARFNRAGGRDAAYAAAKMLGSLSDNTADPGRVRAPTLLIWPDEDRMIPTHHARRLSRAIAGATLKIVPACGHNVHLERPDEFLRQLQPFLADKTQQPMVSTPIPAARSHAISR
jgi:pimeloyl-ACP methyl ester carboxylesterase